MSFVLSAVCLPRNILCLLLMYSDCRIYLAVALGIHGRQMELQTERQERLYRAVAAEEPCQLVRVVESDMRALDQEALVGRNLGMERRVEVGAFDVVMKDFDYNSRSPP